MLVKGAPEGILSDINITELWFARGFTLIELTCVMIKANIDKVQTATQS